MKTMSFNVLCAGDPLRRYWTRRRGMVSDLIRQNAPDTFGVQEAHRRWMNYLKEALPEYDAVGVGRDDGKNMGEFSAVFYLRDRFELLEQGSFWLSETPGIPGVGWDAAFPRICSYALLLDRESGKKLAHFNTHLDHVGQTAQLEGAKLLAKMARKFGEVPTLLTGDFNAFPYSEPYMAVTEGGFFDARKKAELTTDMYTFHNFDKVTRGKKYEETLDYIFMRNIGRVREFSVLTDQPDGKFPSDHYPILAEFEI